MKKLSILVSFLLVCLSTSMAQQLPILSQSQINPFLLNPAYAGNSDWANLFLHANRQWDKMPQAPQRYFLTADGSLNQAKIGLGFTAFSNSEYLIKNNGASLTYRYKMRLSEHQFLSGGISAGFVQNRLDLTKALIENPEELSDFQGPLSNLNFDFNLGLLYQYKGLEVGAAVKQLPNTSFVYEYTTTQKSLTYGLIRHYELSAAYHWRMNDYLSLTPLLVMQSAEGMPLFGMLNAQLSYMDNYWIGLGYKLQSGYNLMAGFVISDRLIVGYNYTIPSAKNRTQFGATQEIAIGYRFSRQSKKASSAENISKNSTQRLQEITQHQSEEIDRLKQANEELKDRMDKQQKADSRDEQLQQLLEIYARDRAFTDSLMQLYSVNIDSLSDEAMQQDDYFMVLGAYYNLSDAKVFQKILEREASLETRITASANGRYFFVYSKPVKSKKEAAAEFKRLTDLNIQKYISGNLWIYKNRE